MPRLGYDFYRDDAVTIARALPGMDLVTETIDHGIQRFMISETEAYLGSEDRACHSSRGRTPRNDIMFARGGYLYVYFIYGMHWMMNIVTGEEDSPQAVLIRGALPFSGPGRVTRGLHIDSTYNGEDLLSSTRVWVEDNGFRPGVVSGPRVGINYAGEPWVSMPWRFMIIENNSK